jgi:hypothetical protein
MAGSGIGILRSPAFPRRSGIREMAQHAGAFNRVPTGKIGHNTLSRISTTISQFNQSAKRGKFNRAPM